MRINLMHSFLSIECMTRVKTGGYSINHNETRVRVQKPAQGLKVKHHVKAGADASPEPAPS